MSMRHSETLPLSDFVFSSFFYSVDDVDSPTSVLIFTSVVYLLLTGVPKPITDTVVETIEDSVTSRTFFTHSLPTLDYRSRI